MADTEKKVITILDFELSKVFTYNVNLVSESKNHGKAMGFRRDKVLLGTSYLSLEDFIIENGHSLGNCEWMLHDSDTTEVR